MEPCLKPVGEKKPGLWVSGGAKKPETPPAPPRNIRWIVLNRGSKHKGWRVSKGLPRLKVWVLHAQHTRCQTLQCQQQSYTKLFSGQMCKAPSAGGLALCGRDGRTEVESRAVWGVLWPIQTVCAHHNELHISACLPATFSPVAPTQAWAMRETLEPHPQYELHWIIFNFC